MGMFGFAGCGDPFNDDELGRDEVENKVTIRFGYLAEEKDLAVVIKREFEKQNDTINLKMEPISGDWKSAMNQYVAKPSNFPDIVWVPSDQHSSYSKGGAFVDLRPLMEADEATAPSLYYDSMIETTHYSATDEGIWYAPRDYNKPVTYINKKMFAAAGVEIPAQKDWNYEKFLEVCAKLRKAMDENGRGSENFDAEKFAVGIEPNSFPVESEMWWNPVYHSAIESFGGFADRYGFVGARRDHGGQRQDCRRLPQDLQRNVRQRLQFRPAGRNGEYGVSVEQSRHVVQRASKTPHYFKEGYRRGFSPASL